MRTSRDMTLMDVTSIKDPLRPGVREAVTICNHVGAALKVCTGNNVLTAYLIVTQCDIDTAGGIAMEGPTFRASDPQERTEVALVSRPCTVFPRR
jgi:Ca2+-transporting ATPase